MAGAPGEDEEVPDGVVIAEAVPAVEDDAGRVEEASGEEEKQSGERDVGENRFAGDEDEPAHGDVDGGG